MLSYSVTAFTFKNNNLYILRINFTIVENIRCFLIKKVVFVACPLPFGRGNGGRPLNASVVLLCEVFFVICNYFVSLHQLYFDNEKNYLYIIFNTLAFNVDKL